METRGERVIVIVARNGVVDVLKVERGRHEIQGRRVQNSPVCYYVVIINPKFTLLVRYHIPLYSSPTTAVIQ